MNVEANMCDLGLYIVAIVVIVVLAIMTKTEV